MAATWSIVESPFDIATAKAYEGLFTLGSGYLHVRGSLEEHLTDAPQNATYTRVPANVTSETFRDAKAKWGTYMPGIFGPHPLLNREMINLPFFLGIEPIVDGEKLDAEHSRIEGYRRELRLDSACLMRALRWHCRSGPIVGVRFERFVSGARPHLCIQRLTLKAETAVAVTIRAGLDADVRTNGHDHFESVDLTEAAPAGIRCRVRTDGGDDVFIESRIIAPGVNWQYRGRGRTATLFADITIPGGGEFVLEKRSAVTASRDLRPSTPGRWLDDAASKSYEELELEHAEHWRRRWVRSDVIIEGDDDSQHAMRVSLYHLLRAHVPEDARVAIDAKGYAGEAYWGRFFWDTEMYLLPFFLYTDPALACTLVDFRVNSLGGARSNAKRYGYPGARYAWESDAEGYECCPNWQYADHEVHVTADVAYGLAHYAEAADQAYLRGPAARVLVETARYWLQRLDWRAGEEHPSLLGVMGPDEYTPISSNNAYTNRMVKHALLLAAEHGAVGGATASEREAFARAARSLPIPRHPDGVLVLQCEEFESLAEPRFEELWLDRTRPFAAQVSQERLYRSKCLKQADVLMMMALFPQEFTDAEVRWAWDYYLPYTTHDSSLSAGIHAIVATRLGLDEDAWRFWQRARGIDLDVRHGGAAEGVHIAGAGANWQVALFGFAGMHTAMQADALTFRPRLPARWSRLAFPLVWKGRPVSVEISPAGVTIANRGVEPLDVCVAGEQRVIAPGNTSIWTIGR